MAKAIGTAEQSSRIAAAQCIIFFILRGLQRAGRERRWWWKRRGGNGCAEDALALFMVCMAATSPPMLAQYRECQPRTALRCLKLAFPTCGWAAPSNAVSRGMTPPFCVRHHNWGRRAPPPDHVGLPPYLASHAARARTCKGSFVTSDPIRQFPIVLLSRLHRRESS